MKVLRRLERVWDRIVDAFMILAGVLLWGQMLIVNVEVFARYFARPTSWVAEISSILVLWIPFMVTAWVLRKEGHVRMDLFVERLRPRTQAMINFFTSLVGLIVMLIVAGAGLLTTIYWIGNKTPTVLMLPRSPIIGIIFVGSFMFAVQFLIRALDNFTQWRGGKADTRESREAVSLDSMV